MKKLLYITAALMVSQSLSRGAVKAQEENTPGGAKTLQVIAASIDSYKNRNITMTLRLKIHDTVFEKIVFYDENNHDIEFSIEKKKLSKGLKRQLINLHNGMFYRVTFIVRSKGAMGLVTGDLVSFIPLVMERLP